MKWAMQIARQAPDAQSGAADGGTDLADPTAVQTTDTSAGQTAEASDVQAPQSTDPNAEPEPLPDGDVTDVPDEPPPVSLDDRVADLERRVTGLEKRFKHF